MRAKQNLTGIKCYNDITKKNTGLIARLKAANVFEKVWFYNCSVFVTIPGHAQKRIKFGLFEDIDNILRQYNTTRQKCLEQLNA